MGFKKSKPKIITPCGSNQNIIFTQSAKTTFCAKIKMRISKYYCLNLCDGRDIR